MRILCGSGLSTDLYAIDPRRKSCASCLHHVVHGFNYDGKILWIDITEMLFLEGVIQVVFFSDRFYDMRGVVESRLEIRAARLASCNGVIPISPWPMPREMIAIEVQRFFP